MVMPPFELTQALSESLSSLNGDIGVAVSGGADSLCLAYCLSYVARKKNISLFILHVHHGLFTQADQWTLQVRNIAQRLDRHCEVRYVQVVDHGLGEEAAAREARYDALVEMAKRLGLSAVFLGHHRDDAVETVLQRIFRGTGITGLSGIPARRHIQGVEFVRPWLAVPRGHIMSFAQRVSEAYQWKIVQDPSNLDKKYARGLLRCLNDDIETHWPDYKKQVSRLSQLAAETQALVDELTQEDWRAVRVSSLEAFPALQLSQLLSLSVIRQKNLLRYLLQHTTGVTFSFNKLDELLKQLHQGVNSSWSFSFQSWCWYVYRDVLSIRPLNTLDHLSTAFQWQGEAMLVFPSWGGRLLFEPALGSGWSKDWLQQQRLLLTERREGAELKRAHNRPRQSLKKIFQDLAIPSIERVNLPCLYQDDKLLWVAQIGLNWNFPEGIVPQGGIMLRWEAD